MASVAEPLSTVKTSHGNEIYWGFNQFSDVTSLVAEGQITVLESLYFELTTVG